jgi:hypothetical protein
MDRFDRLLLLLLRTDEVELGLFISIDSVIFDFLSVDVSLFFRRLSTSLPLSLLLLFEFDRSSSSRLYFCLLEMPPAPTLRSRIAKAVVTLYDFLKDKNVTKLATHIKNIGLVKPIS